jgi:molybdopterin biosynthesis enzyme
MRRAGGGDRLGVLDGALPRVDLRRRSVKGVNSSAIDGLAVSLSDVFGPGRRRLLGRTEDQFSDGPLLALGGSQAVE